MSGAPEGYEPFPAFAGWVTGFDSSAVDAYAARLTEARQAATPEAMARAVAIATRYAAVDTGAIEGLYQTNRGFTRTVAEQTATWQEALRQHGLHVERSISDALDGYEMVLDLATGREPLSQSWIRQLHEVICASQETYEVMTSLGLQRYPLSKGRYKQQPNNPTNSDTGRVFHYAPPVDTPPEMARLVQELESPEFEAAHPVVQASYAHYAFVRIHPFADGNGRVARALASVYLYRRPGVPLVVFADQKAEYLDAIEAADAGRSGPFASFMAERVMDTIGLISTSLSVPGGDVDAALTQISRDIERAKGRPDRSLLVMRVRDEVVASVMRLAAKLSLPPPTRLLVGRSRGLHRGSIPQGYVLALDQPQLGYTLRIEQPVKVEVARHLSIWEALPETSGPELLVHAFPAGFLEVPARQLEPVVQSVVSIELDVWLDALAREDVSLLSNSLRRALAEEGRLGDP